MQIQLDNIGSGERLLQQIGEEEFVDDARTRDAHRAFLLTGWTGRYHHAAQHPFGSHRYLWAVVKTADTLAFWTLLNLIWGQMQARLDQRMIEGSVFLASRHKSETGEVCKHCSSAILAIEPEQRALL
jgi:hypothetical protein